MKFFRLLPAVIVLGATLLVLKGTGLVHEASAQGAETAPPVEQALAPGLAPVRDAAEEDAGTTSAAEVDVLSSLAKRRAALDARARDQDMRESLLAATEKRVDDKIAALRQLQADIARLLGQRDAEAEKQIVALVKTYSAMKPKDAARIFDGLSDEVLVPVAQRMKSDALAPVLAAMNPSAAQKLTVKLAARLDLPQTVAASAVQTAAATPIAAAPQAQPATQMPGAAAPAPASAAASAAQPASTQQGAPPAPPAPQPAPAKHG